MDNPTNPFEEALKDFKPLKEVVPEEEDVLGQKQIIDAVPVLKDVKAPENTPEQPWRHPETKLLREDHEAFELLCNEIGLNKQGRNENRYWRVRDCFDGSHDEDMSYQINRWLGSEMSVLSSNGLDREQRSAAFDKAEKIKKIVEPLLQRGYEARAVKWLLSRTPEKMKYGNGSRELRLEEAKKSAKQAGKTIEEIAEAHGLEHLLV